MDGHPTLVRGWTESRLQAGSPSTTRSEAMSGGLLARLPYSGVGAVGTIPAAEPSWWSPRGCLPAGQEPATRICRLPLPVRTDGRRCYVPGAPEHGLPLHAPGPDTNRSQGAERSPPRPHSDRRRLEGPESKREIRGRRTDGPGPERGLPPSSGPDFGIVRTDTWIALRGPGPELECCNRLHGSDSATMALQAAPSSQPSFSFARNAGSTDIRSRLWTSHESTVHPLPAVSTKVPVQTTRSGHGSPSANRKYRPGNVVNSCPPWSSASATSADRSRAGGAGRGGRKGSKSRQHSQGIPTFVSQDEGLGVPDPSTTAGLGAGADGGPAPGAR